MKIFLTGHKGYVGNVLHQMLRRENFDVIGCDVEYYPQDFFKQENSGFTNLKEDIRDITKADLNGCSAIIHLAALSNDPLGEINPTITNEVNFLATVKLAKLAKAVGVERFVFSSSCSTYGSNNTVVNEESPLSPLTAYANSKVDSELEILKLTDDNFSPIVLRNATAYGISPSQRLDLVVNNLTGSAYTTGKVKLLSDGTSWRPLVHVEDMSRAFIQVLIAPQEKINGQIFNVGSNEDNYTINEIAKIIEEIIPNSKIEYSEKASKDSRTYKVSFDKIANRLGFKTKWNLRDGIKQIYEILKQNNFSENDFKDKKFYRVPYIKWLIEQKKIDEDLRIKEK